MLPLKQIVLTLLEYPLECYWISMSCNYYRRYGTYKFITKSTYWCRNCLDRFIPYCIDGKTKCKLPFINFSWILLSSNYTTFFAFKDTKIGIIGLYKNHQSLRHNSEIKMPFDTWVQFEIMASPGGGSGVIHASANAGPGGGAGAGNPRKFAEKIQILNIKGAEETSEFEKIMSECAAVRAGHQPESGPHPTDATKVP